MMNEILAKRITHDCLRGARVLSGGVVLVGLIMAIKSGADFFITADQRGQRLLDQTEYQKAAETFADPYRQAVAYYRAGDFEKAASWFGGLPSAEASFNQANSLVMMGNYDEAIAQYDRVLQLRPDWQEATVNREIAVGRAKRMDFEGGDMTGGKMEADGFTFDKKPSSGEPGEVDEGGQELGDEALRAMWLRQVQTTPTDFLRAKFAYQQSTSGKESERGAENQEGTNE